MATTTKSKSKPAAVAAQATTVTLLPVERLAELAERRDLLTEQLDLVQMAPRPYDEAAADVDRVVDALAVGVDLPVGWLAQDRNGAGQLAHLLSRTDQQEYRPTTAAQLLAWAMPGEMGTALRRDLKQAYQALPKPMPTGERLAEMAKLQREIAQTAAESASVWWQAIDSGVQPPMPDISGAALIGLAD